MRIVLVNRFAWPEEPASAQLLGDLADAFSRSGHEVHIVTGRPPHAASTETTRSGVQLHRVFAPRWGRVSLPLRVLDFGFFVCAAFLRLRALLRRGDHFIALSDPPLLCTVARLASLFKGVRLYHWFHDIHPEVLTRVHPGTSARLLNACLKPFRNWGLRGARASVVPGDDMRALLAAQAGPSQSVHVFHNWAPEGIAPASPSQRARQRTDWGITEKFLVMYSGNLGRVHDNAALRRFFRELLDFPDIACLVAGSGAGLASLGPELRRHPGFHLLPLQPRANLASTLAAPDLQVVTLLEGCQHTVFPSKLYGAAAAGKPLCFLGPQDCEIASQIRAHGMGLSFSANQIREAAQAVLHLLRDPEALARMGDQALAFHRGTGGASRAAESWLKILNRS